MTVIVGYTNVDEYYIAGDGEISGQGSRVHIDVPTVFAHDDFLIGFTGSVRGLNALRDWKAPRRPRGMYIHDYICERVRKSLEKQMMKWGLVGGDAPYQTEDGVCFLIVTKYGIYMIDNSMAIVGVKEPYAAIGSGSSVAKGALAYMHQNRNYAPVNTARIESVVQICADNSYYVDNKVSVLKKERYNG